MKIQNNSWQIKLSKYTVWNLKLNQNMEKTKFQKKELELYIDETIKKENFYLILSLVSFMLIVLSFTIYLKINLPT